MPYHICHHDKNNKFGPIKIVMSKLYRESVRPVFNLDSRYLFRIPKFVLRSKINLVLQSEIALSWC